MKLGLQNYNVFIPKESSYRYIKFNNNILAYIDMTLRKILEFYAK
jgi:hypothetical protein